MSGADVRLNTERLEAVAKAIYEWDKQNSTMRLSWEATRVVYLQTAEVALAADAAGSWNDTERLRTALTDLIARCPECRGDGIHHWYRNGVPTSQHECETCAPCDWCGSACGALAASVPSPPAKAQK